MVEPKSVTAKRMEVFTGPGGRRRWSDDEKAKVLEETLRPDVVISEIARRHGLTPQQLFTWRRQARRFLVADPDGARFAPVVVETGQPHTTPVESNPHVSVERHEIELDVGGSSVWIWRGANAGMVTTIIRVKSHPTATPYRVQ
jgi:transposase